MQSAYAVGGSATSLRRLCGDELSPTTLDTRSAASRRGRSADAARRLTLARERVRLLPAGLILLRAASPRLADCRSPSPAAECARAWCSRTSRAVPRMELNTHDGQGP